MSIAEYCFVSSMLTILGLLVIFSGIVAIGDAISMHRINKKEKKNREEFIDWLMTHFRDPKYYYKTRISNDDDFCYVGTNDEVYSLYKLNDSLCDCVRKRGEEEK